MNRSCARVGVVLGLLLTVTTFVATAQTGGPDDPITLFGKLMPVFTHPRCINCHGVVQSFPGNIRSVTGETHPGEQQGDTLHAADCGSCHNETPEIEAAWQSSKTRFDDAGDKTSATLLFRYTLTITPPARAPDE